MQILNTPERYGLVALTTHWLTVVLVIFAWGMGQGGDLLPKGAPRDFGLFLHMSAGLAIIALVGIRLAWRIVDAPPPPVPTALGRLVELAGHYGHLLLYVLLIAASVAGVVTQFARGNALPVFGIMEFASPWPADRVFSRSVKGVHELLANALIVMAGLHAAAALIHHWLLRDNTLQRMWPGLKP